MTFNREAFEAILQPHLALHGLTPAAWARNNSISPGALHEIRFPRAGRPAGPSPAMIRRLAAALGVAIGAITSGAAAVAS